MYWATTGSAVHAKPTTTIVINNGINCLLYILNREVFTKSIGSPKK